MSNSINVIKTADGWTVTKNGQTFIVTDSNKNNIWDNSDAIKTDNGGTLNAEDIYEAKYLANAQDGVTAEEMAEYAEFKKLQDKRDTQEAQKQEQQKLQQYSNTKKSSGSFFQKAAPWVALLTQVGTTAAGIWSLFDNKCNSWFGGWGGYGCCNDANVRYFSNMANYSLMQSQMTQSMMGLSTGLISTMPTTFSSLPSLNLNMPTLTSFNITNPQTSLDNWLKAHDKQQTKTEAEKEKEYEKTKKDLVELQAQYADNAQAVPVHNKEKIDNLLSVGKIEYTEDDVKTIKMLKEYTYVPLEIIGNGDNQINERIAKNIQEVLKKYHSLDLTSIEDSDPIKSAANALIEALVSNTITETEITKKADELQKLINELPKQEETSQQTTT